MTELLRTRRFTWAIAMVAVVIAAVLSYLQGSRYLDAVAAVEHTLEVTDTIDVTLSLLKDAETGQRGFLLTADERFLEPYNVAEQTLAGQVERLRLLTRNSPPQQQRVAQLEQLIEFKRESMARTIQLTRAGQNELVRQLVRSGEGRRWMDQIRSLSAAMRSEEDRLLKQRSRAAQATQLRAKIAVVFGSAIALLLTLAGLLTAQRDVAELKRAAEELALNEELFRLLADNASDFILVQSMTREVTYASPSCLRILGYTPAEMQKLPLEDLLDPEAVSVFEDILKVVTSPPYEPREVTHKIRAKTGDVRWFETRVLAALDGTGRPAQLQYVARDITERREAVTKLAEQSEQLRTLSLRDELTGLYNRRGFLLLAQQQLKIAVRDRQPAALYFADLNGMKHINDRLGHESGDRALQETAQLLKQSCRDCDVVARLGGDEFVIFAREVDHSNSSVLRQRFLKNLDNLNAEPQRQFRISISIGCAFWRPGDPTTMEQLLAEADHAMYAQKRARMDTSSGHLPIVVFKPAS